MNIIILTKFLYFSMFYIDMLKGDSMKMGNTFWPNLAMKTWFFTHVLDRIPQNAYMPCEFRLAVKKNCRILCWLPNDIFFLNIPMSFNMWKFSFNELCDLKNLKKVISGSCPSLIIQSYINNLKKYIWAWSTQNALWSTYFFFNLIHNIQLFIIFWKWPHLILASFYTHVCPS